MICLDASVVAKWVLRNEERAEHAVSLIHERLRSRETIIAPPLLYPEITNIAFQQVRRGLNLPTWAIETLNALVALPITIMSPPELYTESLWIAVNHNMSATYDAQYVALAKLAGCDFWTDDERLVRAVRQELPFVRPLSEYEPRR